MTHSPSIIPVILAAGGQLNLWPLSRHDMPLQFQRQADGSSRFEKMLTALETTGLGTPAIISVPARLMEVVSEQIQLSGITTPYELFVEPMDRGSLPSAIAACIIASGHQSNPVMALIDAGAPPSDWEAVNRLIQTTKVSTYLEENIICCGQPADSYAGDEALVEPTMRTSDPNLSAFRQPDDNSTSRLFQLGSITIVKSDVLIKSVQAQEPTLLNLASRAIQQAAGAENMYWPATNLWSALETKQFAPFLADCEKSLLRPFDGLNGLSTETGSRNLFQIENNNCVLRSEKHLLAIAGCEGLSVFSTNDATMIVPRNRPDLRDALIARLSAQERAELYSFRVLDDSVEEVYSPGIKASSPP